MFPVSYNQIPYKNDNAQNQYRKRHSSESKEEFICF